MFFKTKILAETSEPGYVGRVIERPAVLRNILGLGTSYQVDYVLQVQDSDGKVTSQKIARGGSYLPAAFDKKSVESLEFTADGLTAVLSTYQGMFSKERANPRTHTLHRRDFSFAA